MLDSKARRQFGRAVSYEVNYMIGFNYYVKQHREFSMNSLQSNYLRQSKTKMQSHVAQGNVLRDANNKFIRNVVKKIANKTSTNA